MQFLSFNSSMEFKEIPSPNPVEHAKNIEDILASLKNLCESEVTAFSDPKAKALLQTSAEVLGGLERAFHHYLNKDEEVWLEEPDQQSAQKSSDPWD